jgi:hypothetical protein
VALGTAAEELRAKADIWDAEKQRLEAANAELWRSLLLREEQKVELVQQGARSQRELEARWASEGSLRLGDLLCPHRWGPKSQRG